jgi:WD40 repeat protein
LENTNHPKKDFNYNITLFNNINFHASGTDKEDYPERGFYSSRIHHCHNTVKVNQNQKVEFAKILSTSKLSEKENESSVATQETIVDKRRKIDNSNSNITDHTHNSNSMAESIHTSTDLTNSRVLNEVRTSSSQTPKGSSFLETSELRKSVANERPFYTKKDISKTSYNPLCVLKYHLDAVREVYLTPDKSILVSVGEDMCVNFWDVKRAFGTAKDHFEPYITIRTHTTPIYTLAGSMELTADDSYCVYTSGIDGFIRGIKVPNLNTDKYKVNEDIINENLLSPWRAHQDMIWQLSHHPSENILASISCDGSVKLFKVNSNEDKQSDRLCNDSI